MRLSREAWASGRRKLFVVSLVAQNRSTESTELRSTQSLGTSGARASSSYARTYTYTGRRWDADLSLYYFRARYVASTLLLRAGVCVSKCPCPPQLPMSIRRSIDIDLTGNVVDGNAIEDLFR